jgi:hypothetical protein
LRLGIAGELTGQAGFIFVALALYDLLKGVNRKHASLMTTLIVVSIPIAFVNELNSIAALVLVRGADFLSIFEKPQRDALAMLFLNLHHHGFVVAEIFWRLWLFPLGLLVYRSRFLPRFLGVWIILAGFAWVVLSLTGILLPQYQDKVDTYARPAFFGEIAFMLWLLVRGARPPAALSSAAGFAPSSLASSHSEVSWPLGREGSNWARAPVEVSPFMQHVRHTKNSVLSRRTVAPGARRTVLLSLPGKCRAHWAANALPDDIPTRFTPPLSPNPSTNSFSQARRSLRRWTGLVQTLRAKSPIWSTAME